MIQRGSDSEKKLKINEEITEFYYEETALVAFFHIGGNLDKKRQGLIDSGVDTIILSHLSSCLCFRYEQDDSLA